jgi:inosose dehydratase
MMSNTRRSFLQGVGAVAAVALVGDRAAAQKRVRARTEGTPTQLKPVGRAPAPFELAVASYTFRGFPLDATLAMTKRLGIKHICLKSMHLPMDAKPDAIAAAVAKVKAAGLDLYSGGVIDLTTPEEVNLAFDYAKAAGMRIIIGMPTAEALPLINEKVQQYDICVAIHNHGPGDKHFPRPGDAYEKIKNLDRRIGLCIDIGHTVRIGDDLNRATERCADRILDIHIKDETAATPAGQPCEIGRGVIDIPSFLRTLKRVGYKGYLSFEYEKDGRDPLLGLAESVGYVRGVMAAM